MRNYSRPFRDTLARTGAPEVPLLLLEISHAALSPPARLVADNQNLTHQGNTFIACGFRATLPDDLEEGQPRANIAIDNVGRELTQWLEASGGGRGATVRMIQVRRSAPNDVEWEVTLDLTNVRMNLTEISGTLGFDDILNLPAVPLMYRPDVAPGLFA